MPASVAVDEGLRAYMLRVYNYMIIGLAITGARRPGIYMISITGDMSRPPATREAARIAASISL